MSSKIALIGSGNVLFKDEGIGIYGAKYIEENYLFSPVIEIVDGGVLGFELIALLMRCERVIIVNISSGSDAKAGKVIVETQEEFLESESRQRSVNEAEIMQMLQLCSLAHEAAHTTFISMVPEDICSTNIGVSQSIKENWQSYVCAIIKEIESCCVRVEKKKREFTLDEVVALFADSSVALKRGF